MELRHHKPYKLSRTIEHSYNINNDLNDIIAVILLYLHPIILIALNDCYNRFNI